MTDKANLAGSRQAGIVAGPANLEGKVCSGRLRQRPGDVFTHQHLRVAGALVQGTPDGVGVGFCPLGPTQRIAQRHSQISQPAHMPDAADRAALRTLQKRGLVPLPQFQQGGLAEVMPFVEIRQGACV